MNTNDQEVSLYHSFIGWVYFLPVYLILIGIAYNISSTIFQQSVDKEILFGISLSKEQIMNFQLFIQLSIAISIIAVVHLLSIFTGIRFVFNRHLLALMLIAALMLFILGINLPLINTTKFYFFKENYSLIEILSNLKSKNEILLFYIMLVFTFIVPFLKISVLGYNIFFSKAGATKSVFLNFLSKWAMIDVLVVAVLISCFKSDNSVVVMSSSHGLIYFTASVLMSLLITTLIPYMKLR